MVLIYHKQSSVLNNNNKRSCRNYNSIYPLGRYFFRVDFQVKIFILLSILDRKLRKAFLYVYKEYQTNCNANTVCNLDILKNDKFAGIFDSCQ